MFKVLHYILNGLRGILFNKDLRIETKLLLYYDYVRLVFHLITKQNRQLPGKFFFKAFNYTIDYENVFSFFFIVNEIFCTGEYVIYTKLKNFIDLGANIGLASLWYHFFNPKANIYCFEPDKENFRYLQKNMKQNHIRNCFLYNCAVSNKVGSAKFYRILDNIQNLDSGLKLNLNLPHTTYPVKLQKVSTLIKKIKHVSLLKMDIEGGEKAVFKDLFLSKTIQRIDRIIFENHFFNASDTNEYTTNVKRLNSIGNVHSVSKTHLSSINIWERKK